MDYSPLFDGDDIHPYPVYLHRALDDMGSGNRELAVAAPKLRDVAAGRIALRAPEGAFWIKEGFTLGLVRHATLTDLHKVLASSTYETLPLT